MSLPDSGAASDETLLAEYQKTGDRSLFETLMRRYENEIYCYLRRYLGDNEMAEDAFQGTFLQIHLRIETFDLKRRFRPWLYGVATNQAIDLQRRNRRHNIASLDRVNVAGENDTKWSETLIGATPDPLFEASMKENGEWVRQAVDSLADPMRQVIELVYYQGMKYREAAECLEVPVGTVKSRMHATVQQLRNMWEDSHAVNSLP